MSDLFIKPARNINASEFAKLTMSDLMKQRAEVREGLAAAESLWLEASEALLG